MSHHSAPAATPRKFRIHHLVQAKSEGRPLTMLTAYDALTAPIFEAAGVDMLLVGDSLGNVMLGHDTTLKVTLDDIERATAAVARSVKRCLIIADMPFGTYEADPAQAFDNAARLMRAGAHAVKLEGGAVRADTIRLLVAGGIPVIGHLGYTPQSENTLGGPRMQGRGDSAARLLADAFALEEAGVAAIVLEMVPDDVATEVTRALTRAATIGIGAGPNCDGQVLVWSDMAGMGEWVPSFVRRFGELGSALHEATASYVAAVTERSFPGPENFKAH